MDSNFQHSTMDSLLSGLIVSIQKVILHILDFITFASKTFNILELLEGLPLGLTDSIVRGKCTNNNFTIRKNLTWNIVNSELRTQSLNNITIHSKSQMLHARNGTFWRLIYFNFSGGVFLTRFRSLLSLWRTLVGGYDHLKWRGNGGREVGGGGGELRGEGDLPASPSLRLESRDGDSLGREAAEGGTT